MRETTPEKLYEKGIKAIGNADFVTALALFERLATLRDTPVNRSFLAFCIARERGQFKRAISMCEDALKEDPQNSVHYLNLGRIHILAGQKDRAIELFREGLGLENNKYIIRELNSLGIRRPPVIPFLARQNPINKLLGKVFLRLGLR